MESTHPRRNVLPATYAVAALIFGGALWAWEDRAVEPQTQVSSDDSTGHYAYYAKAARARDEALIQKKKLTPSIASSDCGPGSTSPTVLFDDDPVSTFVCRLPGDATYATVSVQFSEPVDVKYASVVTDGSYGTVPLITTWTFDSSSMRTSRTETQDLYANRTPPEVVADSKQTDKITLRLTPPKDRRTVVLEKVSFR